MLKKHIFQQKSSCDIFKSMLDMDLMFLGAETHPMGTLWSYYQTSNLLNGENPLTFSQQLPFLAFFLAIFTYSMG